MPLRKKLLLAMLIPAALLGLVGAIGVYSLLHLEQAAGRILADNYRSIQQARRMERALRHLDSPEGEAVAAGQRQDGSAQAAAQFEEALGRCEGNITVSGELVVLARIRSRYSRLRPSLLRPKPAAAVRQRAERRTIAALYGDLDELILLNEQAMIEYEEETRHVARMMLGAVATTALVAMIALAVFSLISAYRISRPVTQVADRLHEALKADDDTVRDKGRRSIDEIERLRSELDALLHRLARYEDEQSRKLSHLQGRLAFVMNEVLEGLVLLDEEHRVMATNRVARIVLGPASSEGARLDALELREDVRQVLAPLLAAEHQAERDLGELTYEIDGEERIYRPRVLPVTADDGSVQGHLLLFWDVTEQRRFEESRRRLISMLSHQLKTPMTSLSMSVNLLRERLDGLAPAQSELLAIATESCNSLAALVADLIEAAREVTPGLVLKPRRVDLVRLLRSALRPLSHQAEDKGIELVVPPEGEGVAVRVDPVKFPWVVTNIAGNALRYTERGGQVAITVRRAGGHVRVAVQDTGAGIARENLERIFQPFVSLDREPQPGTHGLGLAIAKEIVEAHGGQIEANSEPGQGTEFVIRLPA